MSKAELHAARKAAADLGAEADELKEQLGALTEQLGAGGAQSAELAKRNTETGQQLAALKRENADLSYDLATSKARLKELEPTLRPHALTLHSLRGSYAAAPDARDGSPEGAGRPSDPYLVFELLEAGAAASDETLAPHLRGQTSAADGAAEPAWEGQRVRLLLPGGSKQPPLLRVTLRGNGAGGASGDVLATGEVRLGPSAEGQATLQPPRTEAGAAAAGEDVRLEFGFSVGEWPAGQQEAAEAEAAAAAAAAERRAAERAAAEAREAASAAALAAAAEGATAELAEAKSEVRRLEAEAAASEAELQQLRQQLKEAEEQAQRTEAAASGEAAEVLEQQAAQLRQQQAAAEEAQAEARRTTAEVRSPPSPLLGSTLFPFSASSAPPRTRLPRASRPSPQQQSSRQEAPPRPPPPPRPPTSRKDHRP